MALSAVREARHDGRICCFHYGLCVLCVEGFGFTQAWVSLLRGVHTGWSLSGKDRFAFCDPDGVADVVFAETSPLPRHLEIGDRGLGGWKGRCYYFGDGLGGVGEEGEGCKPDVMSFG